MSEPEDLQSIPLMDRFRKAEYIARELSEHLKQGFLPRLSGLRTAVKIFDPAEVSDQEILDRTLAVLEADKFAVELQNRLMTYLQSIRDEMQPLLFTEEKLPESTREQTIDFDFEDLIDE
ncbi:MAG: hypothetical protein KDA81_15610 [Planctomycetaceae bacterium]|nr:hypothetical protein [Planctomycetaceae bacterium]